MTLTLPSELVVERFLPTVRSLLVVELHDRGFTQQAIATRLGISQAAVSKYLSEEQTGDQRLIEHPQTQATVTTIAEGFASETMDEYEALAELLDLVQTFEDRGPICELHEEAMPALQGLGCDLCVRGRDHAQQVERDVLTTVRTAVRQFATMPSVAPHVPNVGTNIAMALPNATDETDIAAIPGRLHAMRGDVHVPSDPEFGASQHVARVILAARTELPAIRGALNLRTTEELVAAARNDGITPVAFDASYDDREKRLQTLFEGINSVPCIVYHEGAFGIEPITYVLDRTAVEAVETAEKLVSNTSTNNQ
jgi:predicted fused transcriptional regulator/phosphomethylpyrimidine kinase/predicted transcriptional regulator